MLAKVKKYPNLMKGLFIGWLCVVTSQVFAFDLKAKYKEMNFTQATVPACGDESQYIPALPTDPRAELYYQAARKILGQDDTSHYQQMYILGDKAAQMGHWQAKLLMASLYLRNSHSEYTEFNPAKAKDYVTELLEQNVPEAFYAMGQYKLNGMPDFIKDPIPASVYLFEAAKLNSPRALSDMYDIFMSVGRAKDARAFLDCAVKQKQGTASSLYKMANVLEEQANTEAELEKSFELLYSAAKAGSYDAIASFPNKEVYYKQQYSKEFFNKEFLDRMQKFQDAMNALYTHNDPYRKAQGKNEKVKGNIFLTFPNLDKVLPFPPAKLPEWKGDISIALSLDYLKIYQTDFDYDKLVKEAQAINTDPQPNKVEQPKK